jgi:hypothetical protein
MTWAHEIDVDDVFSALEAIGFGRRSPPLARGQKSPSMKVARYAWAATIRRS